MSNKSQNKRRRKEEEGPALIEKVIYINRVAKVVKGGRRFSFSSIVVVGDGKGMVGVGFGKANEVPEAIRKGTDRARRVMKAYPMVGSTVPHAAQGNFGAGRVLLKPASPGTGVIAGPVVRAIMDTLGVKNVLTKVMRSTNPHNVVRATMEALDSMESLEQYAARLGRDPEEIAPNYNVRYASDS